MTLIQLKQLSLSYGNQVLLDNVSYAVSEGERICLLGRNGVGKSTLLKLLTGELTADEGEIQFKTNLRVAKLDQNLPKTTNLSAFDFMASAFADAELILSEYHRLTLIEQPTPQQLNQLADLQQEIEHKDLWQIEQRILRWLAEISQDDNQQVSELSGGRLRLLALARALLTEPDVLLLDEPTNHLDIQRIEWLENRLQQWVKTLVFITHDRTFANKLATQIIELDRGHLTVYPGNLNDYFRQKEHEEATELNSNALQDKKLAQEETWIRQGIKARRTRNEGRVRALKALRDQVKSRRVKLSNSQMTMASADASGKLVAELQSVAKSYSDKTLFKDLDLTLLRGDRLGILGDNGSGKSTLIKIILGEIMPDDGQVRLGSKLELAYFDQRRDDIDLTKSVFDNVADGHQYVTIAERQIHVMSYLQQYLFSPERVRTPAKALSGGELSRLALAKLMAKPFNLLIMDEPTNDLDMETLEVLENQLTEYSGTLILISHDRNFIDNTVSTVIHLDGKGTTAQCVGGYTDWLEKFNIVKPVVKPNNATSRKEKASDKSTKPVAEKLKLSYKEQRELDSLPSLIEQQENEFTTLQAKINTPEFMSLPHDEAEQYYQQLANFEQSITDLYSRWEELS